jgi:hypothetical protein
MVAAMSQVDVGETTDYQTRIAEWRGGKLDAGDLAMWCGAAGDHYLAYLWFIVAEACGDDDATETLETMEETDEVSAEDVKLAFLQAAVWFARGIVVPSDVDVAMQLLRTAAPRFVDLGLDLDELTTSKDPTALVAAATDKALAKLGFPDEDAAVDAKSVEKCIKSLLGAIGFPNVDWTRALGPAMPDTPHNLHPRHAT